MSQEKEASCTVVHKRHTWPTLLDASDTPITYTLQSRLLGSICMESHTAATLTCHPVSLTGAVDVSCTSRVVALSRLPNGADQIDGAREVRRSSQVSRSMACSNNNSQGRRSESSMERTASQADAHPPRPSYCVGSQ